MKIDDKDWKYISAALVTYSVDSFQCSNLQRKIEEILEKYT